jgi:hypothetical protein
VDPGLEEGVSPLWLMLMALAIGTISGVISSLVSEKAIRRNERERYRRETLANLKGKK